MIEFIKSYFFRDKERELMSKIERLEELNSNLYDELESKKSFELDYKLIKAYVDDDDAILELFDLREKKKGCEIVDAHWNRYANTGIAQIVTVANARLIRDFGYNPYCNSLAHSQMSRGYNSFGGLGVLGSVGLGAAIL